MMAPGSSAPLPDERRTRVLDLLQRHGTVRVQDLAAELDVSVITIRRDISMLAAQGLIRRVRGGATVHGVAPAPAPAQANGNRPGADAAAQRTTAAGGAARRATIGMVVPSLDYYWPDIIRGAREAAEAAAARIVLRGATYEAADERRQLNWLVETVGVDGLLVAPTTSGEEGAELVRWLQAADIPVVLLERTATIDPYQEAMESVVSDHVLGAAMAVRHLTGRGHERIGVITTDSSPTTPHVRRGWRQACTELGLELAGVPDVQSVSQAEPGWPAARDELLDQCLASGTTALLVHSDPEAISLVERCQERGIGVPGDLAFVSYDDEVAELCDPPLTAIRPPKAAIGRAAFTLLEAQLRDRDPERPAHRVVIGPRLIVRSSSA